jgi:hypothetical protein
LKKTGEEVEFQAGDIEETVNLSVTAVKGVSVVAEVNVTIIQAHLREGSLGIPQMRTLDQPCEPWRSRWCPWGWIEYNVGHKDYKLAKKNKKTHIKYMTMLYAKHLVMHNFQGIGEEAAMERLLELMMICDSKD